MASAVAELLQYITSIIGPAAGDPRTAASVRTPLGQLASRTKWLKERSYDLLFGVAKTISATNTGTDVLTSAAHGLVANDAVQVFAANGGVLPTGLSAGTVYYVDYVDADTFKLSATSGPGATVDITVTLSGDCYVQKIPDALGALMTAGSYGIGTLASLAVFVAGTQTITGAKTFAELILSGVTYIKTAPRSVTRGVGGTWVNTSAHTAYRTPALLATGLSVQTMMELPHGQTLTAVTIAIDPAVHGSLPTMPTLTITKITLADGTLVTVGTTSATDGSADAAAFSLPHEIAKSGLSEVIDNNLHGYRADFTSSDADQVTITGLKATCTITGQRTWV